MARNPRRLVSLGALCGLALVAGCGRSGGAITISSDAPPSGASAGGTQRPVVASLASLRQAADDTTALTSARYEVTVVGPDGAEYLTSTGEFADDRTHQSTSMGGAFGDDGVTLDIETVTDAATYYARGSTFGFLSPLLGEGEAGADADRWYRFDMPDGLDPELGSVLGTHDFGPQMAKLLGGAYGEVATLGTEDVRGTATTHHRVDIDPSKVVGTGVDEFFDGGTIPVDVWVGDDGLVHRLRYEIGAGMVGAAGGGDDEPMAVSTFEMWDVGADITVDVPADATEIDLGELFGWASGR